MPTSPRNWISRKEIGETSYSALLRVPDAESADRWGWAWSGPDGALVLEEERTPEERTPKEADKDS